MESRENRLIDIKELSHRLGIRPQTIRNQLSCGTFPLPPRKLGRMVRWHLQEVEAFMDSLPVMQAR